MNDTSVLYLIDTIDHFLYQSNNQCMYVISLMALAYAILVNRTMIAYLGPNDDIKVVLA